MAKVVEKAMAMIFAALAACATILCVPGCGCGGNHSPEDGNAAGPGEANAREKPSKKTHSLFPVDDLPPDTVVISINGSPIRQSDYAAWRRLRSRMFRVANKIGPKERNDKTETFERDSRMRIPAELVRREMMRQAADKLGIEAPAEELVKARKRFMAALRRPKEPYSAVGRILGEKYVALVEDFVRDGVREELAVAALSTNNLASVSEAEIDERIKYVKDWNERADATNAVQRARAAQARADILSGGNFAEIASNRSDKAKNEGAKWLILDVQEALDECEALGLWLARSDVGDISDPIELEDGLSVVGVVQIYEDADSDGDEPPQKQYELVRCLFDVYETLEEPEDRQEVAKEILGERKSAALRETFERLAGESKIEFPLDDRIFMPDFPKKKNKKAKPSGGRKETKAGRASGGEDKAVAE